MWAEVFLWRNHKNDGWVEVSGADAPPPHSASNVKDGNTLNLVPGRIAFFASG